MKTQTTYYQEQKSYRIEVNNSYPELMRLKKEDDSASFNALLLKIIPQVEKYINGRLNTAIKKGNFSKGKYKADEFIDQLFIEVYNNIEEVKKQDDFYLWLFKKTNELLEDIIVEEEFDEFFFKNIDDYTKPEWDAMEENFSTDGGGDYVMIEDLEDRSYNHNDYTLNHVFIEDDEKKLTEKIDKDLSEEQIKNHIELVLHNLPLPMRSVFELSTQWHFELEEIAKIQNIAIEEVKELLKSAKKALQVSLFNRYVTN
ncbi:RNA polymerase sigma factor [Winogradskyella thalassocola]|uniref:DNA-directed RNA polymerase specialized sigma subunit, sigma24 family n=1 Tax=Winogradskyella thalassocola TaxID=262004 RepID=A0A1G8BC35_9FLAO|nr:RNA polymerase subunit sigma-70 [Winogradskyella thalassocola]SDH30748.1 DNA-directed RNA polymerase specialized sigma subunit, sigma24 family [Winogradskyella thalassocola]